MIIRGGEQSILTTSLDKICILGSICFLKL